MSNEVDDFMSQGGGGPLPSFKFDKIGDKVTGTVISTEVQEQTAFREGDDAPVDKNGNVKKQLRVVLQTKLRDWDKVSRVPTDADGGQLDGDEDEGVRAIYVRGWMKGAVADAVRDATGKSAPQVGGTLSVTFTEEVPTKGFPYKKFSAKYKAPDAADEFFQDDEAEQVAKAEKKAKKDKKKKAKAAAEPTF
jgi:hypothetical protein